MTRLLARLDSLRGPALVVVLCAVPLLLWAIQSLRSQLRAAGMPDRQIDAEEFAFANPHANGVPLQPRWSDGQVLALLAGFAFVGLAVAAGVFVMEIAG